MGATGECAVKYVSGAMKKAAPASDQSDTRCNPGGTHGNDPCGPTLALPILGANKKHPAMLARNMATSGMAESVAQEPAT